MLIGVYVFALAMAAGLVLGLFWAIAHGLTGALAGKLGIIVVFIALAILRGLWSGLKPPKHEPGGMLVPLTSQPKLAATLADLGRRVGSAPPDEVRLVLDVNAAVTEESSWLGLRRGIRRLYLGVPLLYGLSENQVRSVLAHELGHYSGRHTALGAVVYRGKEALGRIIGELGPTSLVGRAFLLYLRAYVAVSHSVTRRQELEADQASAAIVGTEVASSALTALGPLSAGWQTFRRGYIGLGSTTKRRPANLFGGLAAFLADPTRQAEMAEVAIQAEPEKATVYDTHPPLSVRLAALAGAPKVAADGPSDGPSDGASDGPGVGLLTDPQGTIAAFESWLYADSGFQPASWQELVASEGAAVDRVNASLLARTVVAQGLRTPTLAGYLDDLRSGSLVDRAARLLPGNASLAEQQRTTTRLLSDTVGAALVEHCGARYTHEWSRPWTLRAADGELLEQEPLVAAAVADPAAVDALENWLREHRVPLDVEAEQTDTSPDATRPGQGSAGTAGAAPTGAAPTGAPTMIIGAMAPVNRTDSLIVLDTGVALRRTNVGDFFTSVGGSLTSRLLREGPAKVVANRRTIVIPWADLARVDVGKVKRRLVITFTLLDGSTHTVKGNDSSRLVGNPFAPMAHYLGGRYFTDDTL